MVAAQPQVELVKDLGVDRLEHPFATPGLALFDLLDRIHDSLSHGAFHNLQPPLDAKETLLGGVSWDNI